MSLDQLFDELRRRRPGAERLELTSPAGRITLPPIVASTRRAGALVYGLAACVREAIARQELDAPAVRELGGLEGLRLHTGGRKRAAAEARKGLADESPQKRAELAARLVCLAAIERWSGEATESGVAGLLERLSRDGGPLRWDAIRKAFLAWSEMVEAIESLVIHMATRSGLTWVTSLGRSHGTHRFAELLSAMTDGIWQRRHGRDGVDAMIGRGLPPLEILWRVLHRARLCDRVDPSGRTVQRAEQLMTSSFGVLVEGWLLLGGSGNGDLAADLSAITNAAHAARAVERPVPLLKGILRDDRSVRCVENVASTVGEDADARAVYLTSLCNDARESSPYREADPVRRVMAALTRALHHHAENYAGWSMPTHRLLHRPFRQALQRWPRLEACAPPCVYQHRTASAVPCPGSVDGQRMRWTGRLVIAVPHAASTAAAAAQRFATGTSSTRPASALTQQRIYHRWRSAMAWGQLDRWCRDSAGLGEGGPVERELPGVGDGLLVLGRKHADDMTKRGRSEIERGILRRLYDDLEAPSRIGWDDLLPDCSVDATEVEQAEFVRLRQRVLRGAAWDPFRGCDRCGELTLTWLWLRYEGTGPMQDWSVPAVGAFTPALRRAHELVHAAHKDDPARRFQEETSMVPLARLLLPVPDPTLVVRFVAVCRGLAHGAPNVSRHRPE